MNLSVEESPLVQVGITKEKMERWVHGQVVKGEKTNGDIYGKPSELQMRDLETIRNLSKELQGNLNELETSVRVASIENEAMTPTAPILDFSEDHEFVSSNKLDGYYAEEDQIDAKEEERQRLTKGMGGTEMQEFFKGQCVFLTGGTGFLGKVLIEKILRSCGDIDTIYVLIRNKKGKDAKARIHEVLDDFVFHKAHKVNPKGIHKVVPIVGNMESPGLGMSDEDRKMLTSRVTIIINAAATVKFDEKLPLATAINVKGTKEVLKLARSCKNLLSMTHVSTAFSNTHQKLIEEKFYEPPMSVETLEAVSEINDELLESITPTLLGDRPNTYCFTKAIAEEAVRTYGEGLPICIVRPAIVVSTYEEPVRGWTDSMYGPTGLMVGIGTGMIRTMYMDNTKKADLVPVDLTVNALLASAWHTAKRFKENQTSDIPIYNFVSGAQNPITWGKFIEMNRNYGIDKPTMKAVWYYGLNPTDNYYMFLVYNFFLHYLPALLVDTYCKLTGRKSSMLHIYNKVMKLANILFYFSTQDWKFSDKNVQAMWSSLSDQDKIVFNFNIKDMDWDYLAETFLVGIRVYLVKDDLSTLPEARKRWRRMYYMHQALKMASLFVGSLVVYFIFKYSFSFIFGL